MKKAEEWKSHRPRSLGNWIVSGPQGFLEDCRRHPSASTGLLSHFGPVQAECTISIYIPLVAPVSMQGSKDVL